MTKPYMYVLGLGLVLLAGCAEKPVLELQQTREAVAGALDFEADIYAPEAFELAQFNLESGEFAIAEQDQVPVWGRNYDQSLEFLALAFEQAGLAHTIAEANKADVFEQAQRALPTSQVAFQSAFEAVESARSGPVTRQQLQSFEDELASIFVTLNEAEDIYDDGHYPGAFILLQEVRERSVALEASAQLIVDLGNQ
jgi:hypothetical protein